MLKANKEVKSSLSRYLRAPHRLSVGHSSDRTQETERCDLRGAEERFFLCLASATFPLILGKKNAVKKGKNYGRKYTLHTLDLSRFSLWPGESPIPITAHFPECTACIFIHKWKATDVRNMFPVLTVPYAHSITSKPFSKRCAVCVIVLNILVHELLFASLFSI